MATIDEAIAYFAAILGSLQLVWAIVNFARALRSVHWPTVTGRVVASELKRVPNGDAGYDDHADLAYHYEVGGKRYAGSRARYGDSIVHGYVDPRGVAERYPVGAEVTVYYDPNEPTNAVLEPGVHSALYGYAAFGVLFLAYAAYMLRS